MKLFNHGPHVVLDLLSCGFWLPIHLLLWLCAPTVPVGGAASSAAAATIVFNGQGPHPQVMHAGQPQVATYPYLQPQAHYPQQPQSIQPYQPPQIARPAAQPPAWAIEEARERLPMDAPWEAVASMAWEYVHRRERELPVAEIEADRPNY